MGGHSTECPDTGDYPNRRFAIWVFTLDGFFSVVEVYDSPAEVLVRGRFRDDLEKVLKHTSAIKVFHTPDHDYPYRIRITKTEWAEYVYEAAQGIDYHNFKNAALKNATRERDDRYHLVWMAMAGYIGYGGGYVGYEGGNHGS